MISQSELVGLLVVTGGPGVVSAAMKSGKRSICAGPGNPPVLIDETADLDKAARDIIFGAAIPTNGAIVDSGKLDSGNFISANLSNKKVPNESDISPVTILYEKDAYNNGNSFV